MGRKKQEFMQTGDVEIPMVEITPNKTIETKQSVREVPQEDKKLINCLQNKTVIVRFIPKKNYAKIDNPKHVLYGGMSTNAKRTFTTPKLTSGTFVNVLTNDEKAYLEYVLRLPHNALSIHQKVDNFWDDGTPGNQSRVTLTKDDTILHLSDPIEYIKYKVLIANKDLICPSVKTLRDRPKASYQYVIIEQDEVEEQTTLNVNNTAMCYTLFGKIMNDFDRLRVIAEIIEGKPISKRTSLPFLQNKMSTLINQNNALFLKTIQDEYLDYKVLIKKALEKGIITLKGDGYYYKETMLPLCGDGENPTLVNAAEYLALPSNQELKFAIEAKITQQ